MADTLSERHSLLTTVHAFLLNFKVFAEIYPTDPFFGRIYRDTEQGLSDDYALHDGFLFKGLRICVPKSSLRFVRELHNEGHISRDRTLQLVSEAYFWPSLRRDVEIFVQCYHTCQQTNGKVNSAGLYLPLLIPTQAWTYIIMDFFFGASSDTMRS